jgi:PAS domain S-box-containing protein
MAGNSVTQRVEGELGSLIIPHAEILEQANDAIIVTNTDHRIVIWNRRAEELYGFKKEEALGKNVIEMIVPTHRRTKASCALKALGRGESYAGGLLHVTKEGKEIPVRVSVRAIFDSSGRRVGFLGINADVCAAKRNEERIRRQNRELQAFKQVASVISNPMPTKQVLREAIRSIVKAVSADAGGICLVDGSRAVFSTVAVDGAPEWLEKEVSSYSVEGSFSGRVIASGKGLLIHDARNPKRKRWVLPATLKAGFRSLMGVPLVGKKGTLGTLEVLSCKPNKFKSRDLRLLHLLGWQVAGAIENASLRDTLHKAMHARARQASEARHRLMNNLQAITCLLLTAFKDGEWTEREREPVEAAVRRISAMAAIQHQMEPDGAESMDLSDVMNRMESYLREIYGDHHEITFTTAGAQVSLRASSASSLAMAVNELVWNSCRHGFDAGRVGSVAVSTFVKDGTLEIEVRDNGKGIPADFVLDRDANTGLAIVRNLVERDLGGCLTLRRENGTVATMHCQV